MLWIPLALFAALVNASRQVYEKQLADTFTNYTLGFLVLAFAILPSSVLLFIFPIPDDVWALSWNFWWPLLIIWFVLYPLQTYFAFRALREGVLSEVTPMIAFLPVLNTLTSYILIGEIPSLLGFFGICFIVVATFLLLVNGTTFSFRSINKPGLFALISVGSVALGTTLDKISILASTPAFYTFVNISGGALVLGLIALVCGNRDEVTKTRALLKSLTLFGILRALATAASMFAFSLGPTAYVVAVRSSSFLFSSAYGLIKLREAPTPKKILALALFVTGLVLIALF